MKRKYDEYKKLYDEISFKNGIDKDFEVWLAYTWLYDRYPSLREPIKTKQEALQRTKYWDQTFRKRLIEVAETDSRLADNLLKGLRKLELLCEYGLLLEREFELEANIKSEIPILYDAYFL